MLDEEHRAGGMPEAGAGAQPALVAELAPVLGLARVGNGVALLAVASSIAALVTFPDSAADVTGPGWAVAALIASVVMLAICTLQHLIWLRAMAQWRGERDDDLAPLARISWIAHLVSYVVVLFGLYACIAATLAAGSTATSSALLAFSLLFLVVAQVLAGVQFLRVSGRSGTIPAHLRRMSEAIQRRR
ncbi:MAG: hypothetical protein ABWX96_00370 [Propionibacteriaceae bacterium]